MLDLPPSVDPLPVLVGARARESEVEELGVAVRTHHDVVRLDVAMDDLRRVCDRQGFGHLPCDADDAGERQPLRGELPQRRALDQLHRDVAVAADHAGLVDRDDVGMVEGRGERGFPHETVQDRLVIGGEPPDDLQGDVSSEPRIESAVHLAHAPGAEEGADVVGAERSSDRRSSPCLPDGCGIRRHEVVKASFYPE